VYSPTHTRSSIKEGLEIDCGLNIQIDQKEGPVVYDEADLLTVREVARQLRVDDTTVRRWIKNGVLEAITLPHRGARQAYRIRRSTLEALLAAPPQQIVSQ
jgi:excisionase family DNA binding protein